MKIIRTTKYHVVTKLPYLLKTLIRNNNLCDFTQWDYLESTRIIATVKYSPVIKLIFVTK